MTLCPIAIVAGCQKCPAFKVCPLKGVIGDQPAAGAAPSKPPAKTAAQEGLTARMRRGAAGGPWARSPPARGFSRRRACRPRR